MGSSTLISDEWNLVVFYDMRPYWKEIASINDSIKQLKQICEHVINHQPCNNTLFYLNRTIAELTSNNELLSFQAYNRIKRAPLNLIGNLAHSLFGVLDSEYAEEMSITIANLNNNNNKLLELIKNQTVIIDSTLNIMKQSEESSTNLTTEFNLYFNKTVTAINNMHWELHEQRIVEIFNTLSNRITLMTINIQRIQSALLDVIIDTHHGKINPLLLSPKQLRQQLIIIKNNLPPTLRLPSDKYQLPTIYNIMTIQGHTNSNFILYRVKLPLLSYESFELFNIVPVPIYINETVITIEPDSKYFIVNFHQDLYYPLTEQEFLKCISITPADYLCHLHHPLYRKGATTHQCEINILTHSSVHSKEQHYNKCTMCDNTLSRRTISG